MSAHAMDLISSNFSPHNIKFYFPSPGRFLKHESSAAPLSATEIPLHDNIAYEKVRRIPNPQYSRRHQPVGDHFPETLDEHNA